jgi:hypothetical protein
MLFTESGIMMSLSDAQSLKAKSPMLVTESEIVTLTSEVHPAYWAASTRVLFDPSSTFVTLFIRSAPGLKQVRSWPMALACSRGLKPGCTIS